MLFNFDLSTIYAKRASNNRPQEGKITTTHINYCVSVLPNTACQFCLPEETGVPKETHNCCKTLTHQYSFHKNNVQIRFKPQSNHTQCVVLGNCGMVLSKLIARENYTDCNRKLWCLIICNFTVQKYTDFSYISAQKLTAEFI